MADLLNLYFFWIFIGSSLAEITNLGVDGSRLSFVKGLEATPDESLEELESSIRHGYTPNLKELGSWACEACKKNGICGGSVAWTWHGDHLNKIFDWGKYMNRKCWKIYIF